MAVDALIRDDQTLGGAKTRFGYALRTWDDGFGPLWVYRDSMGIAGVVRAQTWGDAWECVLDSILLPIPEAEVHEAYGYDTRADMDAAIARGDTAPELVEGYHYQPNATGTGIVAEDLNGSALEVLTPALAAELEITLEIEDD